MDKSATVDVVVAEADENRESIPPPLHAYVLPREAKKQNKNSTPKKMAKNQAGSVEEHRQDQ
jgi:hypothetical protein